MSCRQAQMAEARGCPKWFARIAFGGGILRRRLVGVPVLSCLAVLELAAVLARATTSTVAEAWRSVSDLWSGRWAGHEIQR